MLNIEILCAQLYPTFTIMEKSHKEAVEEVNRKTEQYLSSLRGDGEPIAQLGGRRRGRKPNPPTVYSIPPAAGLVAVSSLTMSETLAKFLKLAGVNVLDDLNGKTSADFLCYQGFGKVRLRELDALVGYANRLVSDLAVAKRSSKRKP